MVRFLIALCSIFLVPISLFAGTDFMVLEWVEHIEENNIHTLRAQEQIPVILEKKNLPPSFQKVTFTWINYQGPVFFIWQPLWGDFDPNKYNMAGNLEHGTLHLPNRLLRSNVEVVGIVFPVSSVSFSSIELWDISFTEKLGRLFQSHTPLLPSTINLITPKYFGATPVTKVLGIIVLLSVILLLFTKKQAVLVVCLIGWVLWDTLYAIDQKEIVSTTYNYFVQPPEKEKKYFDLGDQYGFAKFVTAYKKPEVGYFAPRMWPYFVNFFYHTYPTKTIWQGTGAELIAVASVPWSLSGGTLTIQGQPLQGEYSVLEQYSESSYLFIRK